MEDVKDNFWNEFPIPFNEDEEAREEGFDFVNPIDVQDEFIRIIDDIARLGYRIEQLEGVVGSQQAQLADLENQANVLRRKILTRHYHDKSFARSADKEVREAFIFARATDEELERLEELEDSIMATKKLIGERMVPLNQLRHRMKCLQLKADWAKQHLDYQKLQIRVETNLGRV